MNTAIENITTELVKSHFRCFGDSVIVEEEFSSSPRISKLLKTASKSGPGPGRPDFIVRLSDEPDLLIVIECKADPRNHQSETLDNAEKFAVDGALYYASHLCREFDVLAIAVSGIEKQSMEISHFLLMRTAVEPIPAFGDSLLRPEDYIKGYQEDPRKFRQDYETLSEFMRELNVRLHLNKVSERDRSLFLSACLIALERRSFRDGYGSEHDATRLADMVVEAAVIELRDAGVNQPGLDIVKQQFEGLRLQSDLLAKKGELREIVQEIDSKINAFVKTHRYRDVLGGLYIEFLRYANSDKGLGIVLTPPHVTELFAEIAQVNPNSVVYDSCAGTGGFLISAMRVMIDKAGGASEVEQQIKSDQLHGVEPHPNIFPLAVSNMYIHQDGKTNILPKDCFDPAVVASMRLLGPNVGLLNPPYKGDKRHDREELEYVANNLECLSEGAVCVAIVPMQCALATRGRVAPIKRELLRRHTLEAVLSMPDELFFNSKVGVVTCVMVFTAHRPHQLDKETFLGYFKDDGFVKRKVGGRIDAFDRWVGVKNRWLYLFRNRRQETGLSVNVQLDANSEWAAEAYMETDYSLITDQHFDETLFCYSQYLFASKARSFVSNERIGHEVALDTPSWKSFALRDLFRITGTRTTPRLDLEVAGVGAYPYVTTQATNNGVEGFYDFRTERGGVLTVDSAVAGYCAYQSSDFSASDHVEKLEPRFKMDAMVALFLTTVVNLEQYRYNYGRKCSQSRLKQSTVRLPATTSGRPDFDYMRRYISGRRCSRNIDDAPSLTPVTHTPPYTTTR